MPAQSPPDLPDADASTTPGEERKFDSPLKATTDEEVKNVDDDEVHAVFSLESSPLTYLYASSDASASTHHISQNNNIENEDDDVKEDMSTPNPLPEEIPKKQATTHVAVSPDVVLASTGKERQKWLEAGRKEIDNLTLPKAITALSPQEKAEQLELKDLAKLKGESVLELPAKVIFTIKLERYKVSIVACGNQQTRSVEKPTTRP